MAIVAPGLPRSATVAICAVVLSACGNLSEILPGTCGVVDVTNGVVAEADGDAPVSEEVLEPPYVAVMGDRLTNGNQVATLEIGASGWTPETLLFRQQGPFSAEYEIPETDWTASERFLATLPAPGDYRISLIGKTTRCRTEIAVTAVLDRVLRTYDVKQGRTEPPPPAVP